MAAIRGRATTQQHSLAWNLGAIDIYAPAFSAERTKEIIRNEPGREDLIDVDRVGRGNRWTSLFRMVTATHKTAMPCHSAVIGIYPFNPRVVQASKEALHGLQSWRIGCGP